MNYKLGWETAVAASERFLVEIVQLKAENELLRAEVERLRAKEQLAKDLFNHHGNDGSLV